MPWVTKFNYEAKLKRDAYQNLKNELLVCNYRIYTDISDSNSNKGSLKTITDSIGDLVGEYFDKYELKKEDYFNDLTKIVNGFLTFQQDLGTAISQCNSKISEWDALIWTEEWEPEEEKYARD